MKRARCLSILLVATFLLVPHQTRAGAVVPTLQQQAPFYQTSLGVQAFLDAQPGILKSYVDEQKSAATIIEDNSLYYSLNPHILLTLLEASSALLSDANPPPDATRQPLSPAGPDGFAAQVEWASQQLRAGLGPYDQPPTVQFADGTSRVLDLNQPPETLALQQLLAQGRTADAWQRVYDRVLQVAADYFQEAPADMFVLPAPDGQPAPAQPDPWGDSAGTGFLHMPWPAGTNVHHLAYFDHVYPTVDSGGDGNNLVMTYLGERSVQYNTHDGHDYSFPDQLIGTPILAAAPGVAYARTMRGNGVVILHDNGYETVYWHLNEFAPSFAGLIDSGQGLWVETGDLLGTSGSSGFVYGTPHLHFEVRHYGRQVDPYGWQGVGPDPCAAYAGCAASPWLWHASLNGLYNFFPPGAASGSGPQTTERSTPPDFLREGASVQNSGGAAEDVAAPPPSAPSTAGAANDSMPPMSSAPATNQGSSTQPTAGGSAPGASRPGDTDWVFPDTAAPLAAEEPPIATLAVEPPDDLLLYVPFDGHLLQEVGNQQPAVEGAFAFEEGRYGQSLNMPHRGGLTFPISQNIELAAGSIALWAYLPETYPANSIDRHYLFAASAFPEDLANGVYTGTLALRRDLLSPDGAPRWNFWTTPLSGEEERDDLTAPDTLDPGWHHFAVTWEAAQRTKALYIDGRLVASTADAILPESIGPVLQVGRFTYGGSQGGMLIDELSLFGRALAPDEIATIAASDTPFPASATLVYSHTVLLDTNVSNPDGSITMVQLGLDGRFADPVPFHDAFRWQLPPREGSYTLEARYLGNDGLAAHITRTTRLNLPPRGTAAFSSHSPTTATLVISATDQQRPLSLQMSQTDDFADAQWQPFAETLTWEWVPDEGPTREATLYVRFRDAEGQISSSVQVEALTQRVYMPQIDHQQAATRSVLSEQRLLYLPLVRR